MFKIIISLFVTLAAVLSFMLPAVGASGPIFTIYNYKYTADWARESVTVSSADVRLNPDYTTWPCGEGANVCGIGRYFSGNYKSYQGYYLTIYPSASQKNEQLNQIRNFISKSGTFSSALTSDFESGLCFVVAINNYPVQMIPPNCRNDITSAIPPENSKPPPISCSLSNGSIDYGSVAAGELAGRKSSTRISVVCSGAANVQVVSRGYNSSQGVALDSNRTLFSRVTINGYSAERGTTISVYSSSSVEIASELRSDGGAVPPGSYSGSLVVTATIL